MKQFITYEYQWNVYILTENWRIINQVISCYVTQENCGVYILVIPPFPLWDIIHFIRTNSSTGRT
jgi:hypothetical protein